MEITFLGTSASWAIPLPYCTCQQCRSRDKKDRRFRSSIYIKPDILFDAPPELPLYFQNYKFIKIGKIFITHSHSDHIFGLKDLFPNYRPLTKKLKIFTKRDVLNEIKKVFPSIKKDYFFFKLPENFEFFPVLHSEKIKTYGILYKGKKRFAYIPDARGIPEKSIKILKNLDLLILDGTGEGENHLKEREIKELILKMKPKKAILTHIGHWKIKHKDLQKKFKNYAKIAYDGMKINI